MNDRHGTSSDPGKDLRCHCGNLVARLVTHGVELKCRRCRRLVIVPLIDNRHVPARPGRPAGFNRKGGQP